MARRIAALTVSGASKLTSPWSSLKGRSTAYIMSRMRMMPEKGTRSRYSPMRDPCTGPRARNLIAARALELIALLREQHVEARQRSVAAADITLQLDFDIFRQVRGIDLLLERPQAVPQHDDLV